MPETNKIETGVVIKALLVSSLTSLALLAVRFIVGHSTRFWFLSWNLLLAWLPLIFAWSLRSGLLKRRWLSWQNGLLSLLWLGFLPNSFYLVSDFIHLKSTGEVSLLFDVVILMGFAWNGLLLGFISVLIVHLELLKRVAKRIALTSLAVLFLLCSFAIYMGRYLAWNTWDILVNPSGILFDVSDRIIKPALYPNTFTTTAMFFVLLATMYYTFFELVRAARGKPRA